MNHNESLQGIIFDMDNTLLQSRIDFPAMKQGLIELLSAHHLSDMHLHAADYTASQIIEMARATGRVTEDLERMIWEKVAHFERLGMQGVTLEPGVTELLQQLQDRVQLFILTNNAQEAAQLALQNTGIAHYFDRIVGREQMSALKPSPSGIHYILQQFPHLSTRNLLFVGDSWIDGKAARDAGVDFLAYQGNLEEMHRRQINLIGQILHISEILRYV